MDAVEREPSVPASRPRDRKDVIARNAAELFSARGFHAVRMEDIAEASGITARALYRHYANKKALLSHVVVEDQTAVVDGIAELTVPARSDDEMESTLAGLAAASLERPRLSLLWQREARHLDPQDFALVRERTIWITQHFQDLILDPRRDDLDELIRELRSWALVSIVSGAGFYESPLTKPQLTRELVAAGTRIVNAGPAAGDGGVIVGLGRRLPDSRREQLIRAAAGLFRARGFASVGIDEIGREAGVVGPALYRYFDTKADVLVAATNRFQEWVALESTRALDVSVRDEDVIARLVQGYVRIALEATDLLAVWHTERQYLPLESFDRFIRADTDSADEWATWLSIAVPALTLARAATLVRAARTLIDDCVRIPHLRQHPHLAAELAGVALASMGVLGGDH